MPTDMYGNEIYLLGESGFGVSFHVGITQFKERHPYFNVFHISDGYHQSLFSMTLNEMKLPLYANIFPERCAEVFDAIQGLLEIIEN